MEPNSPTWNVNHDITRSTQLSTEVVIRSETFAEGNEDAATTWKKIRGNVHEFRNVTSRIAQKFAFANAHESIITVMGQLLDDLTKPQVKKGT